MTKAKSYISKNDKKYIANYCSNQIQNKDKIRVKSLACAMETKYALYEIMDYIREDLRIEAKHIYHAEAGYIHEMQRGHVVLCNDLYYDGVYLHQYIVAKELQLDINQVRNYTIHHIDQDKSNNDINNLWIFFDGASHIMYHSEHRRDVATDIKQFTHDYIESILEIDNRLKIEEYLEVLGRKIAIVYPTMTV